jgi:hypothetical protein
MDVNTQEKTRKDVIVSRMQKKSKYTKDELQQMLLAK